MKIIDRKQNLGITLIALVITIIVLLILAGITIVQLSNNGLFERTKLGKETYKNAQDAEDDELVKYEEKIDSFINGERATYEERISKLENQLATIKSNNIEKVTAWSGTNNSGTVSLGDYNIFDYDYIVLSAKCVTNNIVQTSINSIGALSQGDKISVYNDLYYTYYYITNNNTLTYDTVSQSKHYNYLTRVELIKIH